MKKQAMSKLNQVVPQRIFLIPVNESTNHRVGRIAAVAVMAIFVVLSALTSALPPTDSLNPNLPSAQQNINTGDTAWILTCSALVLLMTPGNFRL